MVYDDFTMALKEQIRLKKARYKRLRQDSYGSAEVNPVVMMELTLLLQEISYMELSFRRDPGVADFMREPETSRPTAR